MADYTGDPGTVVTPGTAGCYPSDFTGPLPEGGQYCNAPNTPTAFGSINSILQAATKTVTQIRQAFGKVSPNPVTVTVQPTAGHTQAAFFILLLAVALVVWLIIRERG